MGWLIIYGIGVVVTFIIMAIVEMTFKIDEISISALVFYPIIWPILAVFILVVAIVEMFNGGRYNA